MSILKCVGRREVNSKGYTLIEILITLSIIAIVTLMATAGFRAAYSYVKTSMVSRQLISEIYLARSTAIRHQCRVTYCTSQQAGYWDRDRKIVTEYGKVLHHFDPLPARFKLQLRNSLGKNDQLTFLPLGFTQEQRASFYLASVDRCIRLIITVSGKIRIEELADLFSPGGEDAVS